MTHARICGTILPMKLVVPLAAAFALLVGASSVDAQQTRRAGAASAQPAPDPIAQAYGQFLLAHRFEEEDQIDQAIAAYKRAMALDPKSADIAASLDDLYMRQNRA